MNKIMPEDPRYSELTRKGFNKRFTASPDYFRLASSTGEVVEAVQEAVNSKRRVAVRSGGHGLEGFATDPAVQVIIDLSLMNEIYYDPEKAAFAVEAGATVGEMYRKLFLGWGVVLPAGEHPAIGMGGHVLGGAFGFLCREYGLAADHLYGVELVTVDATGKAHPVIATRESTDPNRELWWAHTGGGGGNFGIVTRYWLRSSNVKGSAPSDLLPKAPASITTFRVAWDWQGFDETSFSRLAHNFGNWCLQNSHPDSPFTQLFSLLFLNHRTLGKLEMKGLSTAGAKAPQLIDEHLAAIAKGLDHPYTRQVDETTWLGFALNPFPEVFRPDIGGAMVKVKDALLRQPFTDDQIATAYRYLTTTDQGVIGGGLGLASYGGKINTVSSEATASAQRDCILDIACSAGWPLPSDEAHSLAWVRAFYKDLFATSGGVPVPNERTGGSMINHPDIDLADPEWNRSGVPWYTLYYKDNYPRLQQMKARWDPLNIFRHTLSIGA